MIELINSQKSAFIWKINGQVMKLGFNEKIDTEIYKQNIKKYKGIMEAKKYEREEGELKELFLYFGSLPFIRIGIEAFHTEFITMCQYFIRKFLHEWVEGLECPPEKIPSFVKALELMTASSEGKCLSCFTMLGKYSNNHKKELTELMEYEFAEFWGEKIVLAFRETCGLDEIRRKLSIRKLTQYCMKYAPDQTKKEVVKLAGSYTREREVISRLGLVNRLFGESIRNDSARQERWDDSFYLMFNSVLVEEIRIQAKRFISENYLELDIRKDCWKLYKWHGGNLALSKLDYMLIKSPSLRMEVKYYMCHRLALDLEVKFNFVSNISHALNALSDRNTEIKYMADISFADARALHMYLETDYITPKGNKLASTTIGNIFTCCSSLLEYLTGDKRDKRIKSPRPYHNPFSKFRFVNLEEYKKNTDVIPENVAEQLDRHVGELEEHHELLYKIFSNTGMRLKEALFLEADCLEESRYENLYEIKYKPYKVLAARRKAGLEDYHRVLIPSMLADRIKGYILKTEDLRSGSGLPYIFLGCRYHGKVNMNSMTSFVNVVNELIIKNNICDDLGEVWHFTTRQSRKTIAVTLIENGATTAELAYWLGHLTTSTSMRYYAEVRKMKLAQLNTEFFQRKFNLMLKPGHLEKYTEEERRLLYIDFRLEQRKVELGFCMKKLSDGACTERNSIYNCVNCRHLCTGKKYLPYWKELQESYKAMLDQLVKVYHQEGIKDYETFKEYIQTRFLFDCYQNIVFEIMESEEMS